MRSLVLDFKTFTMKVTFPIFYIEPNFFLKNQHQQRILDLKASKKHWK